MIGKNMSKEEWHKFLTQRMQDRATGVKDVIEIQQKPSDVGERKLDKTVWGEPTLHPFQTL